MRVRFVPFKLGTVFFIELIAVVVTSFYLLRMHMYAIQLSVSKTKKTQWAQYGNPTEYLVRNRKTENMFSSGNICARKNSYQDEYRLCCARSH